MRVMDCRNADSILAAWEEEGKIAEAELESLRAHIRGCSNCGPSREALLFFLESESRNRGEETPAAFVEAVMDRIDREETSRAERAAGAGSRSRPPLFALAAAAILVLGIGLGFLASGQRRADTVLVRFVLEAPEARGVSVAGDFNGWSPVGWNFEKKGDRGPWTLEVKLHRGRLYAYNFVIDGERWIPDPASPELVDDGFDGKSSLLRL